MPRETVAGVEAHPAIKRLVEMGFKEEDCRQALLLHKGMIIYGGLCMGIYMCVCVYMNEYKLV